MRLLNYYIYQDSNEKRQTSSLIPPPLFALHTPSLDCRYSEIDLLQNSESGPNPAEDRAECWEVVQEFSVFDEKRPIQ